MNFPFSTRWSNEHDRVEIEERLYHAVTGETVWHRSIRRIWIFLPPTVSIYVSDQRTTALRPLAFYSPATVILGRDRDRDHIADRAKPCVVARATEFINVST